MDRSTERNAELNGLLIDLNRSLLQYTGEAWPWVNRGEEAQQRKITELVARQQEATAALGQLLDQRDWPVDPGAYPTEYTDLHYMSLAWLLKELVDGETAVLHEVQAVQNVCKGDEPAAALLDGIAECQQQVVAGLKELAAATESSSAA